MKYTTAIFFSEHSLNLMYVVLDLYTQRYLIGIVLDGKYELRFFLHVIDYETYMFRTSAMDYFPPHLISCHLNFALCAESVICDCARKIYKCLFFYYRDFKITHLCFPSNLSRPIKGMVIECHVPQFHIVHQIVWLEVAWHQTEDVLQSL